MIEYVLSKQEEIEREIAEARLARLTIWYDEKRPAVLATMYGLAQVSERVWNSWREGAYPFFGYE